MAAKPTLPRLPWRQFFSYEDYDEVPQWQRLLMTLIFSAGIAVPFTGVGFVLYASGDGAWRNWQGWLHWYGNNLVVSTTIGLCIYALYYVAHRIWGGQRLMALRQNRRRWIFSLMPLLGLAIGWPLGLALVGLNIVTLLGLSDANQVARTVVLMLLIAGVFNAIFSAKARQIEAERAATAAQLRLLQAQIEPHFLFNTLANVVSLIDHDAPKAKQMLESFTDYLRSSLTSLRHEKSTLASELDLVRHYLGLLKTRMEDRLQFNIVDDPALREQPLPPLLLQPLVENAIHHGLEPKVEGGHLQVQAQRDGDCLVITVADDGLGLDAPRKRKGGAGMALSNLRERLLSQYGSRATLTLDRAQPGTVATLRLPLQTEKAPA